MVDGEEGIQMGVIGGGLWKNGEEKDGGVNESEKR